MKFSVLMSVYEKEKPEYLDEAINSILNQTKKPSQIVLIKDGTLPECLNTIIKKYKNKYIDLFDIYSFEKNVGLARALNKGLNLCRYEYVARMDSDDISKENRFEIQINYLEKNPEIDILGAWIEEYDEKLEKLISIRKVPLEDAEIKNQMKKICPFNHSTIIYKKSKILKVGGYKNIKLEDYDLWARIMLQNYKMKNLGIILVKNRTGRSMYKKRSGIKYAKAIIQLENELLKYKIINKSEYTINVLCRVTLALSPIFIKQVVYPLIR